MDYFTKWIEAEVLANIWDVDFKKFMWKNIVTRFGVPKSLVSDNSLQFDSKAFRKYYSDLDIKNRYFTLAHPQSNGQVEAMNRVIVNRLKKKLEGTKGRWTEKLLNVLWAYWMTLRRSTGETPYFLTYGAEVVILVEISLCYAWVSNFSLANNASMMSD